MWDWLDRFREWRYQRALEKLELEKINSDLQDELAAMTVEALDQATELETARTELIKEKTGGTNDEMA